MNFITKIDRSPTCCPRWLDADLQKIIDSWVVQDLKNKKWPKGNPPEAVSEGTRRNVFEAYIPYKEYKDATIHLANLQVNQLSLKVLSSPSLMPLNYHWGDDDCEIYVEVKDDEIIIRYVDTRDTTIEYDHEAMVNRCPLVGTLMDFIRKIVDYDLQQMYENKPCCHSIVKEIFLGRRNRAADLANLPNVDIKMYR